MIKKNKILINIGLLIFTIISLLLVSEIFLARLYPDRLTKSSSYNTNETPIRTEFNGSVLLYALKPNSSMYLAGAHVKINSLGFRDYEYVLEKPDDVFRIAILGDSFTFGYGIELEETYTKQLEEMLNKDSKKKFEVLNFGGNGGNTFLEAEYLEKKVLDFEPDLVIVGFFPNDADSEYLSDQEYCLKNNERLMGKNNFIAKSTAYTLLIDRYNSILKKAKLEINFDDTTYYFLSLYDEDNPGFNCFKEGVKKFSKISQKENLETIFIIIPAIVLEEEVADIIYGKVISTIEENNLTVFNVRYFFDGIESNKLYNSEKDGHYNRKGNKIITDALYGFLLNNSYINDSEKERT